MSLEAKMRVFRNTLSRKYNDDTVFSADQMVLICSHMPLDDEALKTKCKLDEHQIQTYGNQLLAITRIHERNQTKFDDCVSEMKAFVNGGAYGMERLGRVYMQIIEHFGLENEKWTVLAAAGVYLNLDSNTLKRRKGQQSADEDDDI